MNSLVLNLATLLLLTVGVVQAQDSDWPMIYHDAQRTSRSQFVGPKNFNIAFTLDAYLATILGTTNGKSVVIGSTALGEFSAFDSTNGEVVWNATTPANIWSTMFAVENGSAFAMTHNMLSYVPDAVVQFDENTGAQVTADSNLADSNNYDSTMTVLSDGTLLITSDALLMSVDSSLSLNWSTPPLGSSNDLLRFSVSNDESTIFLVSKGLFITLDVATGEPILGPIEFGDRLWSYFTPVSSPTNDKVVFIVYNEEGSFSNVLARVLLAMDTTTGMSLWNVTIPYGDPRLYIESGCAVSSTNVVHFSMTAVDGDTGEVLWNNAKEPYYNVGQDFIWSYATPTVDADGNVFYVISAGVVAFTESGETLWSYASEYPCSSGALYLDNFYFSPPISSDSMLFVRCDYQILAIGQ